MGKSTRPSVTGDAAERALVGLVVGFANAPPPQTPDEVIAAGERFEGHPFVEPGRPYQPKRSHYAIDPDKPSEGDENEWRRLKRDAENARRGWTADHAEARRILAGLAEDAARLRVAERDVLAAKLDAVLCREGITEARFTFSFPPGRRFQLGVQPILHGAEEALWYGVALLVDSGRDLARGFARCHAPTGKPGKGECGRFFWRDPSHQRYCSPACARRAARATNAGRQQRFRQRRRFTAR